MGQPFLSEVTRKCLQGNGKTPEDASDPGLFPVLPENYSVHSVGDGGEALGTLTGRDLCLGGRGRDQGIPASLLSFLDRVSSPLLPPGGGALLPLQLQRVD